MMSLDIKSVLIVTFSPNGGCSDLADAATVILSRMGYEVDCLDITYADDRESATGLELHADLLLGIFPIYMRNLPIPVEQFFSRAQLFVTRAAMILGYGGGVIGDAPIRARQLLADVEIPLCRILCCPLEHSYSFALSEKQTLPDSLADVGRFIVSVVKDEYDEELPIKTQGFDFLGNLPVSILTKFVASVPTTVESECIFCGKCASVCPTGAITLDKFAIDSSRCIRCSACVKGCPKKAKSIRIYPWTLSAIRKGFAAKSVVYEATGFEIQSDEE